MGLKCAGCDPGSHAGSSSYTGAGFRAQQPSPLRRENGLQFKGYISQKKTPSKRVKSRIPS